MSKIEGPLGIWPWPILNTLIQISGDDESSLNVKEYNVVRDNQGRIKNIEIIEGISDD